MANYSFTFKDDSLEHHGIDGQKWGVRNGPPYPLTEGNKSALEKRLNKYSYRVVKRSNKKANKIKDPLRKQTFREISLSAIKRRQPEIAKAVESKDSNKLKNIYDELAREILGEYSTQTIYTTSKLKKGIIFPKTIGKERYAIGRAEEILSDALESYLHNAMTGNLSKSQNRKFLDTYSKV